MITQSSPNNEPQDYKKGQLYKRTYRVAATSIGLGLATLSASISLAATLPVTTKSQKISHSPVLLAQELQIVNSDEILAAHNKYREEVAVPPLEWSESLARSAQKWADNLADIDSLEHSFSGYGENIWAGASGSFSQTQIIDSWGSEQQYFIPGQPLLSACYEGLDQCGHYTQIIWRNTIEVGCGLASNGRYDYFVCQYSPPGNLMGEKPY